MSSVQFCLLGGFSTERDGQKVAGFSTRKAEALLYYLAVTKGIHSRSVLAGLLWRDMPEETAKSNLRKALFFLRQV